MYPKCRIKKERSRMQKIDQQITNNTIQVETRGTITFTKIRQHEPTGQLQNHDDNPRKQSDLHINNNEIEDLMDFTPLCYNNITIEHTGAFINSKTQSTSPD